MTETIKKVSKQCQSVLANKHANNNPDLDEDEVIVIQSKMEELDNQFKALLDLARKRQELLEKSFSFYQLLQVLTKLIELSTYFHVNIKNG